MSRGQSPESSGLISTSIDPHPLRRRRLARIHRKKSEPLLNSCTNPMAARKATIPAIGRKPKRRCLARSKRQHGPGGLPSPVCLIALNELMHHAELLGSACSKLLNP
jgi:hypothetical protein